jgi:hypothetical protein
MPPVTAVGLARSIGVVALVFVGATGALACGFSPLAIPFIIYALVPYAALFAAARSGVVSPWAAGGAGLAALTVEAGIRAAVMVWPRGSTAAIALVFSPVFILVIAMPAGAAAGWLFGAAWVRTGVAVRTLLTAAVVPIVGLAFIYFARPELFPTNVRSRNQALAAIGEPRVAAGADRFTRTAVNEQSAWRITGEFDGQPGDELALVDHKGAQLYDLASVAPAQFIPFGGEPGRVWGPFSALVRHGDGYLIANTGGGYSDTDVKTLDNQVLWRFHPDPKLPPTALLPADLDRDGEVEFYASSTDAITRLDARGGEVWRRPSTLPQLIALLPGTATAPPWIVSYRYGVSVEMWRPDGERIAGVEWKGAPVRGIVEWPSARHILAGDINALGIDLEGNVAFQIPLDPLRLADAVTWQPAATSPALLAIVSGGDEELKRWRLRVYETPERVVYDEVFDTPLRLLTARGGAGDMTLFVVNGDTLSVLKPR